MRIGLLSIDYIYIKYFDMKYDYHLRDPLNILINLFFYHVSIITIMYTKVYMTHVTGIAMYKNCNNKKKKLLYFLINYLVYKNIF